MTAAGVEVEGRRGIGRAGTRSRNGAQGGDGRGGAGRCLVVNMFYPPDFVPTAHYVRSLCERLASRGWSVRVITSDGRRPGSRWTAWRSTRGRLDVVRVRGTALGRASHARRLVDYAVFFVLATWAALRSRDFDVVLCMTSPPFVDVVGAVHRALFGSRLVLWCMDCYPEMLARVGLLGRARPAYRALARLRAAAARRTDLAIAIDEEMATILRQEGYADVCCVPNWCHDTIGGTDGPEVEEMRSRLAQGADHLVLYLGNLGAPHGAGTLLDIAECLGNRADIRFAFVGAGAGWPDLRRAVETRGLQNVSVNGTIERGQVGAALEAADLLLMCLKPAVVGAASPSRVYSALCAGKPILFVGPQECQVGRIIRDSRCGAVVPVGSARCGSEAVERILSGGREGARRIGERGRAYYDSHFGAERSLGALEAGLVRLLAPKRVGA